MLYPLLFFVIGLSVYAPALGNQFVLDDESQIVNNLLVHNPANIATFFVGSTMNLEGASLGGIYYKPLMTTLYSVLWRLFPGDPLPFHALQILLVIMNALLVFYLLRRQMSDGVALAASLIFLVHPLNAEVAVYIADLQDPLFMFFGLLALNWIASAVDFYWLRSLTLGGLLLCSLLCKESGILFVISAVLFTALEKREALAKVILSAFFSFSIYLGMRLGFAHLVQLTHSQNQIGRAAFAVRLLTAPKALVNYLWKFVFPRDLTTTQDWIVAHATWSDFWLPLILVLSVLGVSIWYAIRYRHQVEARWRFGFYAFWVFMGMGIHSHIFVPLDGTVADRWFYFSSAGLVAMLGLILDRFDGWKLARPVAYTLVLIIAGLGVRSSVRARDWADQFTLCAHDLHVFPDSYDLHNNLGVELFRRGNFALARKEFQRSVDLAPGWDVNWNNLGATSQRAGNLKQAEEYFLRSMQNGTYYLAYENYAHILIAEGRRDEAKRFVLEKALPIFPASEGLADLARALAQ